MIDVVALVPYPEEAAAVRFRVFQMIEPLQRRGIRLDVHCLLDAAGFEALYEAKRGRVAASLARGVARHVALLPRARGSVVLVHREAVIGGPPVIERLVKAVGGRVVLDLDDATYVGYDSPTYGRAGRLLKWPGKADRLIDMAALVTCGNATVQEYVRARGAPSRLVPTVVDTDVFRPAGGRAGVDPPVVGWIGTHSTFPYLDTLRGVLSEVARTHPFRLLVVGSGHDRFDVAGVDVECRPWLLARDVADFQAIDVGLYPLPDDEWARGKSGLKSIQYLAAGVPFVASPIGAAADIGVPNVTHFEAKDDDGWVRALQDLLADAALRSRMGAAGRAHALAHYHLEQAADAFAEALVAASEGAA